MQEHFIFLHVLNVYDSLLLMTTLLSFLLALPLFLKRDRQTSDLLLAFFLISQGLLLFMTVMYYSAVIGPYTAEVLFPFQSFPKIILTGIQGLLLLWYARAMMGKPLDIDSKLTWICGFSAVLFCSFSYMTAITGVKFQWFTIACFWGLSFFATFTGIYALKLMRDYDTSLPFRFSNTERRNLSWLRWTAGGLVFVWGMRLTASILYSFEIKFVADIISISSNIPPLFLMSAMVVYSQTHAINTVFRPKESDTQKQEEVPSISFNPKHTSHLEDLMIRIKVYQDPELRLEGLADSMDISPRTLSSLLNNHYKKNFYDYVNYYRVLDAQDQLVSVANSEKSIQRIFEDAGFNSKTTFNTLFKKHTGQTPSEFRKRALQQRRVIG